MINDTNIHPAPGYILAEQIKAKAYLLYTSDAADE